MKKEPVLLSPDHDGEWAPEDLFALVEAVRWFRGIGATARHLSFIADNTLHPTLSDDMFGLLEYLQSNDYIDDEILIYASDYDETWTWKICASPLGFAVWQNVKEFGETEGLAS